LVQNKAGTDGQPPYRTADRITGRCCFGSSIHAPLLTRQPLTRPAVRNPKAILQRAPVFFFDEATRSASRKGTLRHAQRVPLRPVFKNESAPARSQTSASARGYSGIQPAELAAQLTCTAGDTAALLQGLPSRQRPRVCSGERSRSPNKQKQEKTQRKRRREEEAAALWPTEEPPRRRTAHLKARLLPSGFSPIGSLAADGNAKKTPPRVSITRLDTQIPT